jgi:hypothetical protein
MRVAETAIERDPKNPDALVGWLDDSNEATRYLAAQGILMLEDTGQPAVTARLVPVTVNTAHNPVESGSCLPVHGIREHAGGT